MEKYSGNWETNNRKKIQKSRNVRRVGHMEGFLGKNGILEMVV